MFGVAKSGNFRFITLKHQLVLGWLLLSMSAWARLQSNCLRWKSSTFLSCEDWTTRATDVWAYGCWVLRSSWPIVERGTTSLLWCQHYRVGRIKLLRESDLHSWCHTRLITCHGDIDDLVPGGTEKKDNTTSEYLCALSDWHPWHSLSYHTHGW